MYTYGALQFRHGPKPGCQEAEAEAFSILEAEAEALTLFKLEAEAGLFVQNQMWLQKVWLQSRSFGEPRSRSLWKSRSRSQSQAPKNLGSRRRSRSLDPKKSRLREAEDEAGFGPCLLQFDLGNNVVDRSWGYHMYKNIKDCCCIRTTSKLHFCNLFRVQSMDSGVK